MPGKLVTQSFGPFRGLSDEANPEMPMQGVLRVATGLVYSGVGQLAARDGSRTALTLFDGASGAITDVLAITPFSDSVLCVGYSSTTQAVYLYRLNSTMTGWYDVAGAEHEPGVTVDPVGTLWTGVATSPDVTVAEGLGVAYIAHCEPVQGSTLTFPTKTFTVPGTIADLTSDIDGDTVAETLYFAGVVSFQQHLWGYGFGSGTVFGTAYRPELARFSRAIFDTTGGLFAGTDSLTLGNRVRSQRERIVGHAVAGNVLFLGAPFALTRVTGYGRDSWHRTQVQESFGFVGPKCMVAVGDTLYYWSSRGPMRITGMGDPEPLWDRIVSTVAGVVNPAKIVAGYDETTDQVVWAYDAGNGVSARVGYDVRRDVFLGPADSFGVAVKSMGTIAPVRASSASAPVGPSGAPSVATTGTIGTTSAVAGWTVGDATASTLLEYRIQGTTDWTVASQSISPGVASYTLSGLQSETAYEWRAAHKKDGLTSAYLGPVAGSQFTTLAAGSPTTIQPPTSFEMSDGAGSLRRAFITCTWRNAGESGMRTELWTGGPSVLEPTYALAATLEPGVSSTTILVSESGTYWGKVRHLDGTGGTSAFSASDTGVATLTGSEA